MRESEPFHVWWDAMMRPPEPVAPEPMEPSAWDIEKAANRLAKTVSRIERGQRFPTLKDRLNGLAARELAEAYPLLTETADTLKGVEHGS